MIYEFVYITISYTCGHVAIRPVLVAHVMTRERRSDFRCGHCTELRQQRYETLQEAEAQREEVGV